MVIAANAHQWQASARRLFLTCRVRTLLDRPEARVMGAVPAKARETAGGREPGGVVTDLAEDPCREDGTQAGRGAQLLGGVVTVELGGHGHLEGGDRGLHRLDHVDQSAHGVAERGLDRRRLAQSRLVEVLQDRVGQPGSVAAAAAPQQGHDPLVGELQAVRRRRDGTEDLERGLVRQHGERLEGVGVELEQRRPQAVHGELASPDGLLVLAGQRLDGQAALADAWQRPMHLPDRCARCWPARWRRPGRTCRPPGRTAPDSAPRPAG